MGPPRRRSRVRAPPPTRRVSARERARVGSIFSYLPRALPRMTRPTQVKGTTKKPTHSPLRACCVHSIRDGRRVESTVVVPRRARARGGAFPPRDESRRTSCVFLSRHGVPSGLARERTLDRER